MLRTIVAISGIGVIGGLLGCTADTAEPESLGQPVESTSSDPTAVDVDSRTNEAADAFRFTSGTACRLACAIAAGATCGAVATACTGATVITIGGVSIPCSMAIIAACYVGGPGGAAVCMDQCPP
jgi:hypothetical protein